MLESGIPDADTIFGLVGATVAVSIALHSTTDVPVANLLGATPDSPLAPETAGTAAAERDADRTP